MKKKPFSRSSQKTILIVYQNLLGGVGGVNPSDCKSEASDMRDGFGSLA